MKKRAFTEEEVSSVVPTAREEADMIVSAAHDKLDRARANLYLLVLSCRILGFLLSNNMIMSKRNYKEVFEESAFRPALENETMLYHEELTYDMEQELQSVNTENPQ